MYTEQILILFQFLSPILQHTHRLLGSWQYSLVAERGKALITTWFLRKDQGVNLNEYLCNSHPYLTPEKEESYSLCPSHLMTDTFIFPISSSCFSISHYIVFHCVAGKGHNQFYGRLSQNRVAVGKIGWQHSLDIYRCGSSPMGEESNLKRHCQIWEA